MIRSARWVWAVAVGCLVMTTAGWAAQPESREPADRVDEFFTQHNLHPAAQKLGRGLGNIVTGWMEIAVSMQTRYTPQDAPTAVFTGLTYGLLKAVARTAVGIYETVTFALPYPENYAPVMPPLEYFRHSDDEE